MRSLPIMREFAPVVFDGTHSVQMPSAGNGVSGGQPEFIPVLGARGGGGRGWMGCSWRCMTIRQRLRAMAANALRLDALKGVLEQLLAVDAAVRQG